MNRCKIMNNKLLKEIYNEDSLKLEDISIFETRVKIFIVRNNEILIACSGGGCQLPGGHVEPNEDIEDAIIREVAEETGMVLDKHEIINNFYEIQYFDKNYKNSGRNRLSKVSYFTVRTDKVPNLKRTNLTEREKKNNFTLKSVEINKFTDFVDQFLKPNQKEINVVIAKEILKVYPHFLEANKN